MRIALLWSLLVISSGLFLAMLAATRRHRVQATATAQTPAIAEYGWALVPWLLLVLFAAPAVRRILATG